VTPAGSADAPRHPAFQIQRAYDPPSRGRSYRVLVDRLWPRGVSKEKADLDEWAKDVAPSDQLRRWYGHEPEKFAEFARRYRAELKEAPDKDVVKRLRAESKSKPVTLVTATKEVEISGAQVLLDVLAGRRKRPARTLD
jgi:uncharacterized protein YeaO (DUF488 family)